MRVRVNESTRERGIVDDNGGAEEETVSGHDGSVTKFSLTKLFILFQKIYSVLFFYGILV